MTTLDDLLAQLVSRGIQLSRDGDWLGDSAASRMTPALAAAVRTHKPELLVLPACDSCPR